MRPNRVFFPEIGFTKNDAIHYYKRVAKWLLPHLKNRPVSFKRYPDTIRDESFWEKDAPSFTPEWVKTVAVPRRDEASVIHYIIINDVRTLTWVVEAGGIEIHPFLHTAKNIERATAMVFDLDPGAGASLADCCRVALILRDALGKLESFAKVSGSKGLQVYVPLNANHTHDETEPFAQLLAEELARKHPKRITAKMPKQFRARRVFIDWSQNADFKTTVSVYSLRAKSETPFVSMPVTWREVEAAKDLYWTPDQALHRIRKRGDLFAEVLTLKQKLPHVEVLRPAKRGEGAAKRRMRGELPKPRSQSGRRLFVLPKTEMGTELWLDMRGKFRRWILRPDREGGRQLIAMPAGEFAIDPAYFRGEVPREWRKRVAIEDIGAYELIDGSAERRRFDLYFSGKTLQGEWLLEKIGDASHRSWRFTPQEAS